MKFLIATIVLYLLTSQITSVYADNLAELPRPVYSASSVLLMDANTGMVLYEYNGSAIKYPASITKIMTALIVLEHVDDLSERILFSDRAVYTRPIGSHIAMNSGETLTVYEALYGIMLESANDVSLALAEHVAGSVEGFVELMNRRARAIGAHDTYFVNPTGLHAVGHVTTAYDFAIIMREAVRHPMFVDIIGAVRFDIPPTERQPEVRALLNSNHLIRPGPHFNESVVGSKTGWTNSSGQTLVTYARQNGRRLIVSVLGGSSPGQFMDTTALLNYGFALPFEPMQIFDSTANTPKVPVYQYVAGARTEVGRVTLQARDNLYFDLPAGFDMSNLRFNMSVPQALAAPVQEGDDLGRVTVYVQDVRIGDAQLFATESVPEFAGYYQESATAAISPTPASPDQYVPQTPAPTGYYYEQRPPFWASEYIIMMAIPLGISVITLIISVIIFFAGRKSRMRKALHSKYARYPEYYRYR